MIERPDALIYDLDGTLLDTEPLYTTASQRILDPYGHEYSMEIKRQVMGGDSRRSAQVVIEKFGLPMTIDEYLAERAGHLVDLFPTAPEMPGVSRFVEAAGNQGLVQAIATSSHQDMFDLKMGKRPWKPHFSEVICGDHPELKASKPNPDIFLLCAEKLGVDPARCIAFEDSPNGLEAALAAGMTVVAIMSPYVNPGALDKAAEVITSFDELLPWLEAWEGP